VRIADKRKRRAVVCARIELGGKVLFRSAFANSTPSTPLFGSTRAETSTYRKSVVLVLRSDCYHRFAGQRPLEPSSPPTFSLVWSL
jgi:hypothetical protein